MNRRRSWRAKLEWGFPDTAVAVRWQTLRPPSSILARSKIDLQFFYGSGRRFLCGLCGRPGSVGAVTSGRLQVLTFRWDTLFVAAMVILMAGLLLAQATLRIDLFRLFDARQLRREDLTDEPNLYELFAERRDSSISHTQDRRRAS